MSNAVMSKVVVAGLGPGSARPRLAVLDGLRFAAAGAVLLYHFTSRNTDVWGEAPGQVFPRVSSVTAFGAYGVELFFVVSGFVILMTAWGGSLERFVASRVGRLFPAYWAGVVLTGLLLTVIWPSGAERHVVDILGNLSMTQEAFGVRHVDGVYWTLWAELRFYVLIAVFIAIGITKQRVVVFAAVWPVVAAMAARVDSPLISELLISDYAPMFAGGMMIYCVFLEPRNLAYWAVLGHNVVMAAVWTGGIAARAIANNAAAAPGALESAVVIIGCFAAVSIAVLTPLRSLGWRWLSTLGALTYPLYLVHEYWGWWLIAGLHEAFGVPVTLVVAAVLCIVLAWIIHRLVEVPVGHRLRSATQRGLEALRVGRSPRDAR